MEKMKGSLSIAKYMNSDIVQITIEDSLSGIEFVRLEMNAEEFARAMFGSSNRECVFELNGLHHVGKKYEYKTVYIPNDEVFAKDVVRNDVASGRKFLEPYEDDDWTGNVTDLFNFHNRVVKDGEKVIKVHFGRYVEVEEANDDSQKS